MTTVPTARTRVLPVSSPVRPVTTMSIVLPAMFIPSRPSSRRLPSCAHNHADSELGDGLRRVGGHGATKTPRRTAAARSTFLCPAQCKAIISYGLRVKGGARTHQFARVQFINGAGNLEVVHEDTDGIVPKGKNFSSRMNSMAKSVGNHLLGCSKSA